MITEKFAAKEARRLFVLPFAPKEPADQKLALDQYAKLLAEEVKDEAHCTAVIDYLVKHNQYFPPPSTLLTAVGQIQAPTKAKAPLGCDQCQGSGYVRTRRMVRNGLDTFEADFAQPCDCALGRFIAPEYERRRNRAPGAAQDLG